jgi:nucleoid-associated protein YgaU
MPLPNLPALPAPEDPSKPPPTQVAQADTPAPAPPPAPAELGADRTAEAAQAELKKAQNRIGLSDAQLDRLQSAQDRIASGDNGGAFVILQALNAELQGETRIYVVQDNESMWHVAGQQEVYGNSYLWPLVWQANRDKVKKPSQLRNGLRLVIPAHPTAQEVAEALAYSKANNLEGMNQADSQ